MGRLERSFESAVRKLATRTGRAVGFRSRGLKRRFEDLGPVDAVRSIVLEEGGSKGFALLWVLNRLDLTLEALVIQARWSALFSEEVKSISRDRLLFAMHRKPRAWERDLATFHLARHSDAPDLRDRLYDQIRGLRCDELGREVGPG